jgi:hypothetical protein
MPSSFASRGRTGHLPLTHAQRVWSRKPPRTRSVDSPIRLTRPGAEKLRLIDELHANVT